MATKGKIMLVIAFILMLLSFNHNCNDVNNVKICVNKLHNKDKTLEDYVITYEDASKEKSFKSIVRKNLLYFQLYAKHDIKMISATDTVYPIGYIFEDDVNGILPIIKQIVTFPKTKHYKQMSVRLFNKESIFELR